MQNHKEAEASRWTILNVLQWTTSYFKSRDLEQPRADAEILLSHTLDLNRVDLYVRYDQPLLGHELERFKSLIRRRVKNEPVAYIIGVKEFWSMALCVTPDVLIPRPETECLVEAALALFPKESAPDRRTLLDLGTGSGAIVLAMASERSGHFFYASDRLQNVVELARRNARRHHLEKSIHFFVGDWFDALRPHTVAFDMIVSNPPYVQSREIATLQPEISRFEPVLALHGGKDGLAAIGHIIREAWRYLKPGGYLLLETGHDHREAVRKIVRTCGHYDDMVFTQDYSGYDRVVRMTRKQLP